MGFKIMKNKLILLSYSLGVLLLAGCATTETATPEAPITSADKLQEAETLGKRGNWQEAYKIYGELQQNTTDVATFENLQIMKSNALFGMGNYPAALAELAPMPEFPETLYDCKKLAMAARILSKMDTKAEYVESLLEVALDNNVDGDGVIQFKAAGYAELGRVYVTNKKIGKAIKCFEYAADLYDMVNNKEQANACRNIMEYLK